LLLQNNENFLYRLKQAWLFGRYFTYRDLPVGFWEKDDRVSWSRYLKTDHGKKMSEIITAAVVESAINATTSSVDNQFRCGIAFGVRFLATKLESLEFSQATADSGKPESQEKELLKNSYTTLLKGKIWVQKLLTREI